MVRWVKGATNILHSAFESALNCNRQEFVLCRFVKVCFARNWAHVFKACQFQRSGCKLGEAASERSTPGVKFSCEAMLGRPKEAAFHVDVHCKPYEYISMYVSIYIYTYIYIYIYVYMYK